MAFPESCPPAQELTNASSLGLVCRVVADCGRRSRRLRRPAAPTTAEMQQRMRDMMQEGRRRMADAKEKMDQAGCKVEEMEERIRKLEAEVDRLKSTPK